MKNKLPKVFANNITKEINNNKKIYTSIENKKTNNKENPNQKEEPTIKEPTKSTNKKTKAKQTPKQEKTINQKINQIMNTKEYIYKIPVKITTQEKEIITKIVGKTTKNLITIENQLIKIEDITNIEKYIENEEE